MSKTSDAAKTTIKSCMNLQPEEKFLILTDTGKLPLAQVFLDAAIESGFDAALVCGPQQTSGEMPALCATALSGADASMMITSGSFTHTQARADATAQGCRIASMPGITEEVVNSALAADYSEVERISMILADKLTATKEIHILTEAGTDLVLNCEGRNGIADTGKLNKQNPFGNLPAGEAMVAPVESKGEGKLVVDGVISDFGVVEDNPITLTFNGGKIVAAEGKDAQGFLDFTSRFTETAKSVCEFGIGTNPMCTIMGNPLVDEKVFGTIHIACGNNLFMGGRQDGNMHYDMIINAPTVYLDGVMILNKGKHIYE